jgi:threonine aldolase
MFHVTGVQAKVLPSNRGRITAAQVEAAINPDDAHWPVTSLVCLENTANKGGGSFYSLQVVPLLKDVLLSRLEEA